ncbi:6070_t:CDS:2 [Acaulospora morrowiae]|uniref:6070_t:CDS:1 n=1 Tax=Acaulospora morrowiae TaxID=94023 RepID=A0A9N9BRG7_9GLOM|nr:6070_t:CDS:2 [Acaulospora morrowiae]
MLSKEVSSQLRYPDYWERSYSQWSLDTWKQFFYEKIPRATKRGSCNALAKELEILANNLKPKSKERQKALSLKRGLKECANVSVCYALYPRATGRSVQSYENPFLYAVSGTSRNTLLFGSFTDSRGGISYEDLTRNLHTIVEAWQKEQRKGK